MSDRFPAAGLKSNFVNDVEGRLLLSAFNSSSIEYIMDGLVFKKETLHQDENLGEYRYYLDRANPNSSFSFSNYVANNGYFLSISGTGLLYSDTTDLRFSELGFGNNEDISNPSGFDVVIPTSGHCILQGDILDLNHSEDNSLDAYYIRLAGGDLCKIKNVRGFYEVTSSMYHSDSYFYTGGGTPPTGIQYPRVLTLSKRTDIIHNANSSSTKPLELETIASDEMPALEQGYTPLNASGTETHMGWSTVSNWTRNNLVANKGKLRKRPWFDGTYKISKI